MGPNQNVIGHKQKKKKQQLPTVCAQSIEMRNYGRPTCVPPNTLYRSTIDVGGILYFL